MSATYTINKKTAGPWVDIDLGGICKNYAFLRDQAPTAKTAAVVKCDAYGLGLESVASAIASREKCDIFFVAYPEEGVALRKALAKLSTKNASPEIFVFNGPLPDTIGLFEQARLTPVLNGFEQAEIWASRMPNISAALHIDTGMNRLGAAIDRLDSIMSLKDLNIAMVMSHLACSSEPKNPKNEIQRQRFIEASNRFPNAKRSLAASGGALLGKDFHFDLIRPGIALYGGSPFDHDEPRLKPVAALRAPVIQMRDAEPGETVGYDGTHHVDSNARLATIALGYGDGFPRSGSAKAAASINGDLAPVVGRVSMDLISLDVSALKHAVKTGDVATFFGEKVSLFEAATACGTIPYEMLTSIGSRVDRRYF